MNSKTDNLSFEVFFLFFANFSRLTTVKDGMLVHHRVPSMKQLAVLPLDGMLVHHRVPSMKQLAVLPLDGMLVHHRVPSMKQLAVLPLDGMPVHHRVPSMKQLHCSLSITTPPGRDASPSQGTQHFVWFPQWIAGTRSHE